MGDHSIRGLLPGGRLLLGLVGSFSQLLLGLEGEERGHDPSSGGTWEGVSVAS